MKEASGTPYWGKVVGTMAGLAAGPWVALVGLVLGHQFDRGYARYTERLAVTRHDRLPPGFVRALFRTMGFLAKSDGRVSEEEIRAARKLMHRLGLDPAETRAAMEWFTSGKAPSFPLHDVLRELRRDTRNRAELRGLFVQLLMEVALSKNSLHRSERAALWSICNELGIGRVELAQLEAMLRAQRGFRKSAAGSADAARLSRAYEILGVNGSATNAEIKQAYRRLMNRNHPDKLGNAADAAALLQAEQRTREIRTAWDMLKTRRSIR
ncbi:MAG TPA: co-chaperone DjlA [Woeseiaceae bacterium]|nr:co-chaperone DjlA [Woeseiaceae bacterium]